MGVKGRTPYRFSLVFFSGLLEQECLTPAAAFDLRGRSFYFAYFPAGKSESTPPVGRTHLASFVLMGPRSWVHH